MGRPDSVKNHPVGQEPRVGWHQFVEHDHEQCDEADLLHPPRQPRHLAADIEGDEEHESKQQE